MAAIENLHRLTFILAVCQLHLIGMRSALATIVRARTNTCEIDRLIRDNKWKAVQSWYTAVDYTTVRS